MTSRSPLAPVPSTRRPSLTLAAVVFAVGVALVVGGWWGASGASSLAAQIPSLNIAVAGLVVSLVGSTVYLLDFRRQLNPRLQRLTAQEEET